METNAAHTNAVAISPEVRHWLGENDSPDQTLVFADIVDSTGHLIRLGDRAWMALLDVLDETRNELAADNNGRVVNVAGDGALAAFPDTDAAIDFAHELLRTGTLLGIEMRVGIHRGPVETRTNGDLAGLAVHVAARIQSVASPGEVALSESAALSSTRRCLPTGPSQLKGIPDPVELYRLDGGSSAATTRYGAGVAGECIAAA